MRIRAPRVDPDCFVEIRHGAIEVALGLICKSTADKGHCILRVEPDRLVIVRDGAVKIAFALVSETAAEIGGDMFGIDAQGFAEIRDGRIEVVLEAVGYPAIVEGCRAELSSKAPGGQQARTARYHAVRIVLRVAVLRVVAIDCQRRRDKENLPRADEQQRRKEK